MSGPKASSCLGPLFRIRAWPRPVGWRVVTDGAVRLICAGWLPQDEVFGWRGAAGLAMSSCGVVATRRKERRFQRIRDIPVAGAVEVLWSKYRWYCEEPACPRLSFFESTAQVPRRARSTGRLRDQVVDAVISSGRAVSETAAAFAVSWWMVRAALTEACLLTPARRG